MQYPHELFYNFIDFKKAFDRVWHDVLWQVLRKFNIDVGLVQVIKELYVNANSAVLFNGRKGDLFMTSVHVSQGFLFPRSF